MRYATQLSAAPSIIVAADPGIPVVLLVTASDAPGVATVAEALLASGASVHVVEAIDRHPSRLSDAAAGAATSSLFVLCQRTTGELDVSLYRKRFEASGGCVHRWLEGDLDHAGALVQVIRAAIDTEQKSQHVDLGPWSSDDAMPALDRLFVVDNDEVGPDPSEAVALEGHDPTRKPEVSGLSHAYLKAVSETETLPFGGDVAPAAAIDPIARTPAIMVGVCVSLTIGIAIGLVFRELSGEVGPASQREVSTAVASTPRALLRQRVGLDEVAAVPSPPSPSPDDPIAPVEVVPVPPLSPDTDASLPALLAAGLAQHAVRVSGPLWVVAQENTLHNWYDAMTLCKLRPFWGERQWRSARWQELAEIRQEHGLGEQLAWSSTRADHEGTMALTVSADGKRKRQSKTETLAIPVCVKPKR